MTNQNATSPALHHQNHLPDSGSVHESQRRQLWLSLHRSHRHTCCVCFCLECFTIFREKRRSLSVRPPATKSPFLLMTNQNTTSPALHQQNQPPDSRSVHEYTSRSSTSFGYRCIAVTAIHAVCVFVRIVFYNFPWREAAQLICLAALRFS